MNEIEKLKLRLAEYETENRQLKFDKQILEEKVDYLTRKLYGSKSEKIKKDETPELKWVLKRTNR